MAFKRAPYWDIVATLSAPDALGERAEFSARMIALGGKRLAGSKDFGADGQLTPDGSRRTFASLMRLVPPPWLRR